MDRRGYGEDDEFRRQIEKTATMFGDDDAMAQELAIGDKLKEENYYKYHENLSEYDPRGQPYSYFYITVMGQVEFGEFLGDLDGLQIHYAFV